MANEFKEYKESTGVWFDITKIPPPNDVQVLVRLEREMLGGWYSVATFGIFPLVGSLFAWDAPKPTHWMYIPTFI